MRTSVTSVSSTDWEFTSQPKNHFKFNKKIKTKAKSHDFYFLFFLIHWLFWRRGRPRKEAQAGVHKMLRGVFYAFELLLGENIMI